MIAYAIFENAVLMTVFAVCLWSLSGRIAPQWRAAIQSQLALKMVNSQASPRVRRWGLKLIPRVADQHCGSACSRCGACGVSDSAS